MNDEMEFETMEGEPLSLSILNEKSYELGNCQASQNYLVKIKLNFDKVQEEGTIQEVVISEDGE